MSEPRDLAALADAFFQEKLVAAPIFATSLGFRDHDAALPDHSPEGLAGRRAGIHALLEEVRALPQEGLEGEDRWTRLELEEALEREEARLDSHLERFLVSPMGGPQVSLLRLPDIQPLRSPEEADSYRVRVEGMAALVDTTVENLRAGLAAGEVSPKLALDRCLHQLDHLLERDPAEWTLTKHASTFRGAAGEAVRSAIEGGLGPAFERMRGCLRDELLPAARGDEAPGLCHLPEGDSRYARCVRFFTSLERAPEEVHEEGLQEVRRVKQVLLDLGQKALGARSLPELREELDGSPDLHFRSAEEILEKAEAAVARATEQLPRICNLEPAAPCRVLPIPELEAPDAPLAYYRGPAADGSRPGTYYVNTHEPTTRMAIDAEGVAFHEAVPGHHLQIAIAQTLELPDFRRFMGVSSYAEGWALYSEKLAEELGLYSRDLDRIGAMSQDLWRAARLVLDTGLHALGWSRQKALDWALAETLLPREIVETEIDRFVVMPGQALSYKLGELEILKLRHDEEIRLGDEFRLVDFHDRILGHGSLSLGVLRSAVEADAGH